MLQVSINGNSEFFLLQVEAKCLWNWRQLERVPQRVPQQVPQENEYAEKRRKDRRFS